MNGPRVGSLAASASLAAWALYVGVASGRLGWADAPELAAAGQQLGIAHAPGQPAYLLLVRLAQLLPVGDLAARAVWLSAATSALVVGAMVLLGDRLLPPRAPRTGPLLFLAAATAVCGPLLIQAVVVELYATCALLLFAALLLVLAAPRHPGAGLGAGLALGLACATNPLMAVLVGPGLVLALVLGRRRPGRGALVGIGAGLAVGLSTLAYLPLRSAAEPGVWLADLDGPSVLLEYLSGRTYGRSFGGTGDVGGLALQHVRLLLRWLGLPTLALGLGGALLGLRERRRETIALATVAVGALGATMTRSHLEEFTPDTAGYLLPTCLVVLLGATLVVGLVARRVPALAAVLGVACLAAGAVQGVASVRLQRDAAADEIAQALLEATPPGGVLLTGSDSTALPVLYAVTAERRRPDVLAVPAYGTPDAVLRAQVARRDHLTPIPLPDGGAPPQEQRLRSLIAAGCETGVVGTVLLWPPELTGALAPAGPGLAVVPCWPGGEAALAGTQQRVDEGLVAPLWRPEPLQLSRQRRRLLTGTASQHAAALVDLGRETDALAVLQAASAAHPDPTSMVHLQRATAEDGRLRRTLAWPPGSSAAVGLASLRGGDAEGARPPLEEAVRETPSSPALWEELAVARFWSGDLPAASLAWDQALELRPGSPWSLAGKERLYSMGQAGAPSGGESRP